MEALTSKLSGAYPLWDCWSQDEKKYFIIDVLRVTVNTLVIKII